MSCNYSCPPEVPLSASFVPHFAASTLKGGKVRNGALRGTSGGHEYYRDISNADGYTTMSSDVSLFSPWGKEIRYGSSPGILIPTLQYLPR
jgi:hypothetical protein